MIFASTFLVRIFGNNVENIPPKFMFRTNKPTVFLFETSENIGTFTSMHMSVDYGIKRDIRRSKFSSSKEAIVFVSYMYVAFLDSFLTTEMLQNDVQHLKIGCIFSEISPKWHARTNQENSLKGVENTKNMQ